MGDPKRSVILSLCLLISFSIILPAAASAHTSARALASRQLDNTDAPTVDPNYIYNQLYYMATSFQHREAGYDNNQSVSLNGHNAFASYWSQEMVRNLQGFGPHIRIDKFPVVGWLGRPAAAPAFNVEVTVPGVTHPEQVVVIGCHYDGEAISTQSANDDTSGCAIELGVARAMAQYWHTHHVYPARTLRFVIFDAEEQGLFGSFHYLNDTINGDVNNIVAMFNEEQNGIAYPLRFLGKLSNPLLPFYIAMSPLTNNALYPHQSQLSPQQKNNISQFHDLMQQAVPAVFTEFQQMGYQSITYLDSNQRPVSQPLFTFDQLTSIQSSNDNEGGSDQIPFTLAGLPCATFLGNSTYYNQDPSLPPWSYPFDQKEDTIQLMNTYASGSSQKAQALTLALALPGMITTWMLHQPDILGEAASDGNPIAAISDVSQPQPGHGLSFDAHASFDPHSSNNPLTFTWNFGDGTSASGVSVSHTYQSAGTYTLALTVQSSTGKRVISKLLSIAAQPNSYPNPYANFPQNGSPPINPAVTIPSPGNTQTRTTPPLPASNAAAGLSPEVFIGIGVLIVAIVAFILLFMGRKQRSKNV